MFPKRKGWGFTNYSGTVLVICAIVIPDFLAVNAFVTGNTITAVQIKAKVDTGCFAAFPPP